MDMICIDDINNKADQENEMKLIQVGVGGVFIDIKINTSWGGRVGWGVRIHNSHYFCVYLFEGIKGKEGSVMKFQNDE